MSLTLRSQADTSSMRDSLPGHCFALVVQRWGKAMAAADGG
ncbi:MAG: hypothetical protein AAGH67_16635 [Cyanobacteria bacterium P01_H01_bin.162]